MPRSSAKKTINEKSNSKRKQTRRMAKGGKIPLFKINNENFLSCYDIRNFLSDQEDGKTLKYNFRKIYQNLERKSPDQRIVLFQTDIMEQMSLENKVHINPNKKTNFVRLEQLENGLYKYLVKDHKIPIDFSKIINLQIGGKKQEEDTKDQGVECEDLIWGDSTIFNSDFELTRDHLVGVIFN